jgi:hypothetical protein
MNRYYASFEVRPAVPGFEYRDRRAAAGMRRKAMNDALERGQSQAAALETAMKVNPYEDRDRALRAELDRLRADSTSIDRRYGVSPR